MGALVYREYGSGWGDSGDTILAMQSRQVLRQPFTSVEKCMGVYIGSKRVGSSSECWSAEGSDLHIQSRMVLDMMALGGGMPGMALTAQAEESILAVIESRTDARDGKITRLNMVFKLGDDAVATIQGEVAREHLVLRVTRGNQVETRAMRIDPSSPLLVASSPIGCLTGLHEGKSWRIATLNPVTLQLDHARARVSHRERLEMGEVSVNTFVVEIDYGGYRATLWADERGEILKQKLLGLTYLREMHATAPADHAGDRAGMSIAYVTP